MQPSAILFDVDGTLTDGSRLYPEVREMLAALRSAGLPLGVVTRAGRRAWEGTAERIGLGEFAVVVTGDEMRPPRPDPAGLLAAAHALGVPADRIACVGGSAADLQAGRAAGARIGAALWTKTAAERESFLESIRPLSPDWTFDRPADLTRAFAPWC